MTEILFARKNDVTDSTVSALTRVDDTNVTLTLGGTPATALLQAVSLTLGWTGTLAASRLNANVVQAVSNDTNITGSIATQTLTLAWAGTLALSRLAQGSDGQLIVGQTSAAPQYKTLSGDATLSELGVLTLASTIAAAGPIGSATVTPVITYDAKGRLTAVSSATITPAFSSITGTPTTLAGYGITDAQPLDAQLTDVAGLTPTDNGVIIGNGINFVVESGATLKTSLGLTIGTDIQAQDATLQSIAALGTAADKMLYTTGIDTWAELAVTSVGRALLDDTTQLAQQTTLGLVIGTNVQAYDADLTTWAGITPGTGVATALAVNVGTTGAFVVNGGALGSPASAGTIPAFTLGGAIAGGGNQLNNIIIGTTTPLAGSFTTLTASTSLTSLLLIGGSGTTGTQLTLKTTTGVGTTDAFAFVGGNNGATTFATLNSATLALGAGGNFTISAGVCSSILVPAAGTQVQYSNTTASNIANTLSFTMKLQTSTNSRNYGLFVQSALDVTDATRTGSLAFQVVNNAVVTTHVTMEKTNVVIGTAALATNATDGFLYIPTCAGTPTGAPTAYTGRTAMVYDTTNNKLYVYSGSWKRAQVAAVDAIYA